MNECWLFRKDRQGRRGGAVLWMKELFQYTELFYGIGNRLVELVSQDQRRYQ